LGRGSWVPILHNVAWVKAYLPTEWHLDPSSHLATTDMGRKLGVCPCGEGGAGSPSNTMWPGPRPTWCQVSSRSVQPFGHNTPTLLTGQDRQRSDSIGRTVLQTVAQKSSGQPANQDSHGKWPICVHMRVWGGTVKGASLESVTHGQCDARPTVTFLALRHHRPLTGTNLYCLVNNLSKDAT